MPTGDAVDFKWYRYTATDGTFWSLKVDKSWGDDADSGFAAYNVADPVMVKSPSLRPRVIVLQDPVSTRITTRPVGSLTADAWTEAGYASTQKFRGLALAVNVAKIDQRDEKIRRARAIDSKPEPVTA